MRTSYHSGHLHYDTHNHSVLHKTPNTVESIMHGTRARIRAFARIFIHSSPRASTSRTPRPSIERASRSTDDSRARSFVRSFRSTERRRGRTTDRTDDRVDRGRGRGVDTVKPSNGRRALDDGGRPDDDRTMAAREMEALTIASMASRDAVSDANERNERNERSMGVRSVGGRAFKRLDGRARGERRMKRRMVNVGR